MKWSASMETWYESHMMSTFIHDIQDGKHFIYP